MMRWEYQITVHKLPNQPPEGKEDVIECDQLGRCFFHATLGGGPGWLEEIFREKGEKGWELVQLGYHDRELVCIWKRRKETEGRA
ncbi:MAG: hypothetical protein HXY46_10910 [Syntrophaceae bacterium]|nr:hypothetical protein [Syntrophaceae bacterium]